MLKGIVLTIAGVVGVLALMFVLLLVGGVFKLAGTNIDRVVTQHTLQYVQSHQQAVLNYYTDYISGDAAHKAAAKIEVCTQASALEESQYPDQAKGFILANCR